MEFADAVNSFTLIFSKPEYEAAYQMRERKFFHKVVIAILFASPCFNFAMAIILIKEKNSFEIDSSGGIMAISGLAFVAESVFYFVRRLNRLKGMFFMTSIVHSIAWYSGVEDERFVLVVMYITCSQMSRAIGAAQITELIANVYAQSWMTVAVGSVASYIIIVGNMELGDKHVFHSVVSYGMSLTLFGLCVLSCYHQEYNMRHLFYDQLIQQLVLVFLCVHSEQEKEQYQHLLDRLPEGVIISSASDSAILRANTTIKDWLQLDCASTNRSSGIRDCNMEGLRTKLGELKDPDTQRTLLEIMGSASTRLESGNVRLKMSNDPRTFEASCHEIRFDCKDSKLTIVKDQTAFEELTKDKLGKKYQKILIASVTHEIRNPLQIETGMLDTLAELQLSAAANTYVEIAKKNVKLLTYMVNDIHDLCLSSTEPVTLNTSRFNLSAALHECKDLLEYQAKQKKLELRFTVAESVPKEIRSDEARYRRILLNLLTNALKYTYTGHVAVAVEYLVPSTVVTTVEDTGIGVPEAKKARLFEFASQLNEIEEKCANPQGIGLGLTMCKKLALALGGDIELESTVGVGSKFTFRIKDQPLVSSDDKMLPRHNADEQQVQESSTSDLLPTVRGFLCSCSPVLIVDDCPINILVIQSYLQSLGVKGDEVSCFCNCVGSEWRRSSRQGGRQTCEQMLQTIQAGAHGHKHARHEWNRGVLSHSEGGENRWRAQDSDIGSHGG